MWVNFHTHQVLPSGVVGVINIDNFQEQFSKEGYYSLGLHPWTIHDCTWLEDFDNIKQIVSNKHIRALGECGFDKFKGDVGFQYSAFVAHIELSEQLCLPLIIHSVGGDSKILELHKKLHPKQPWIMHGFIGNIQTATTLAKAGIYCSFSARSLKHEKTIEVFKQYPLHLSFLETDDDCVTIEEVYQLASIHLKVNLSLLKDLYYNNFIKLFKLND